MKTIMKGIRPLSRAGVLSGLLLFAITSGMAATQVELNGRRLVLSVPPTQVSGRTLVPMRDIFESLGAEVQWNETTRTVTATKADNNIQLSIGSSRAIVNGRTVPLDVPVMILHGSTMVPLRFVSEALGADVKWSSATQMVSITTGPSSVSANRFAAPVIITPQEGDEIGNTITVRGRTERNAKVSIEIFYQRRGSNSKQGHMGPMFVTADQYGDFETKPIALKASPSLRNSIDGTLRVTATRPDGTQSEEAVVKVVRSASSSN